MLQNCNPCTPETAGQGKFYMNVTSFLWQNVKFATRFIYTVWPKCRKTCYVLKFIHIEMTFIGINVYICILYFIICT